MKLPRLIVADEIRSGTTPDGVTLVYAMRRAGIRTRLFICARDETDVYLLRALQDESVVVLDTYTCGSVKNLKNLFQAAADPDALNVILVSLGERGEESFNQVRPDAMELAQALSCGIVPIFSGAASAMMTSNIVMAAFSTLATAEESRVRGAIFASIRNPREYQLLEQDYGRRTPVLSLGYIPRELERPRFSLQDLYNPAAISRILQLKSAGMQLASAVSQIEWQILDALGRLDQDWTPPQEIKAPAKNVKVAIVGDKTLSLEGSNCTELFRLLGCECRDYDPWQDPFPTDVEVICFPHSLGYCYAKRLLELEPFCQGILQSIAANKLIFVNGGSAPLFGRYFISPDGEKHDALGIFSFHGTYSSPKDHDNLHRVEIRCTTDSVFAKNEEKLKGYAIDYVHISNPGNLVPPVMAYRDIRKNVELGNSGWVRGYCFVTDLYIDLWSNTDLVNRWLSLRKR